MIYLNIGCDNWKSGQEPQPALDGRSREGVKGTERDYDRNHSKGSDRDTQRERGLDREREGVRTERRSGRDDPDQRSSKSKHGRSISPSDQHHRNKHTSRSPDDARARDEVSGDIHSLKMPSLKSIFFITCYVANY